MIRPSIVPRESNLDRIEVSVNFISFRASALGANIASPGTGGTESDASSLCKVVSA